MDYSSMLKHLAKEAGIVVPPNSFSKSGSPSLNKNEKSSKLSKCSKCGGTRTAIGWCRPCDTAKLKAHFKNWTSGNEELDQFIRETQLNANTPFDYMRWINFDSFSDVKFEAQGGFGLVYSAKSSAWGKVALKFLDNSESLASDFLDEVKLQFFVFGDTLVVAPFQGPRTKKIKTGSVKSVITNSGAVHPQAFYTSRLLHFPHLPEPRNSETFTLFDPTTGELLTMIRKSSSKRDPAGSATNDNKGKEKAREDYQTHNGRREVTRSSILFKGMTLGKVDKEMIDKLKADRRQHSHYRWSSIINEVPREVELYRVDEILLEWMLNP
ncbi:18739_t:CDS:2 [Rhizophagus irregularis]|nr:18739_t:CDS:2 [Rhizophagus irregularis]